jgi:hypothetical protein
VQTAVDSLITAGSLPSTLTGNESQLVTVPVVNWGSTNGASQVTVLGFAEVWIDSIAMSGSNQVLTVQFVQYVTKIATGGGGSTSYGAYLPPYIVQ